MFCRQCFGYRFCFLLCDIFTLVCIYRLIHVTIITITISYCAQFLGRKVKLRTHTKICYFDFHFRFTEIRFLFYLKAFENIVLGSRSLMRHRTLIQKFKSCGTQNSSLHVSCAASRHMRKSSILKLAIRSIVPKDELISLLFTHLCDLHTFEDKFYIVLILVLVHSEFRNNNKNEHE